MTAAKGCGQNREMARKANAAIERAKLMAAEAGLVAKRIKYRVKTSNKVKAAVVAGAAVTAAAIGVAVAKRARRGR